MKTRKPGHNAMTMTLTETETDVSSHLLGQHAELGVLLLLLPPDDLLQLLNLPVELLPLPLSLPGLLGEEPLVRSDLLLQTLHPQFVVLRPPGGLLCNDYLFYFCLSLPCLFHALWWAWFKCCWNK